LGSSYIHRRRSWLSSTTAMKTSLWYNGWGRTIRRRGSRLLLLIVYTGVGVGDSQGAPVNFFNAPLCHRLPSLAMDRRGSHLWQWALPGCVLVLIFTVWFWNIRYKKLGLYMIIIDISIIIIYITIFCVIYTDLSSTLLPFHLAPAKQVHNALSTIVI